MAVCSASFRHASESFETKGYNSPILRSTPTVDVWMNAFEHLNPEQIRILMHEYDALRAEIRMSIQNAQQILAIGVGIVSWVLSKLGEPLERSYDYSSNKIRYDYMSKIHIKPVTRVRDWKLWFAIIAGVMTIGWVSFTNTRTINVLAVRLGEIEREVNASVGINLLKWQSCWNSVPHSHSVLVFLTPPSNYCLTNTRSKYRAYKKSRVPALGSINTARHN